MTKLRFCIREEGYERKGGRIRTEGSELRDPSGMKLNRGMYPSGGIRVEVFEWRDPSGGTRVEVYGRRDPRGGKRAKGSEWRDPSV